MSGRERKVYVSARKVTNLILLLQPLLSGARNLDRVGVVARFPQLLAGGWRTPKVGSPFVVVRLPAWTVRRCLTFPSPCEVGAGPRGQENALPNFGDSNSSPRKVGGLGSSCKLGFFCPQPCYVFIIFDFSRNRRGCLDWKVARRGLAMNHIP